MSKICNNKKMYLLIEFAKIVLDAVDLFGVVVVAVEVFGGVVLEVTIPVELVDVMVLVEIGVWGEVVNEVVVDDDDDTGEVVDEDDVSVIGVGLVLWAVAE